MHYILASPPAQLAQLALNDTALEARFADRYANIRFAGSRDIKRQRLTDGPFLRSALHIDAPRQGLLHNPGATSVRLHFSRHDFRISGLSGTASTAKLLGHQSGADDGPSLDLFFP